MKISQAPMRDGATEGHPSGQWPIMWIMWFEQLWRGITNYANAISDISVTASPFTYLNSLSVDVDVIVQAGTVSKVEFSRGGVVRTTGITSGIVRLSPEDSIIVTYSSKPNMTAIPR